MFASEQLGILLIDSKGIMKISSYVVVWTRLLGIVNSLIGIGMVFFPSALLQLIGLASTTPLMLLPRLTGVTFLMVGNLYFFGLLESRRDESYEPLRQVWIISACFLLCVALVLGGLVLWGLLGNEKGGIAFSSTTAFVGGWQLTVILAKRFPSSG